MLGLPPFLPGLTDYRRCIDTIEAVVRKLTVAELEQLNRHHRRAGAPALTRGQFLKTPHGRALARISPFTAQPLDGNETISPPPAPWPTVAAVSNGAASEQQPSGGGGGAVRQCLAGIRVLELCRIIAGPTIGRCLAAHGASVLKVTSPRLPDVPFFPLDVNTGKHTASLDLRVSSDGGGKCDRAVFDALLEDADVIIDGYRPGALAALGYGPAELARRAACRGRGIVYVAEDCFGGTNTGYRTDDGANNEGGDGASAAGVGEGFGFEWAARPGWQQIADCATGVAWAQGAWMGLAEPVVPPFPMSDYGTGLLGATAALTALLRRAIHGGSWLCRTSLAQYDAFLLGLGELPTAEQARLRTQWARADEEGRMINGKKDKEGVAKGISNTSAATEACSNFFALRHSDSVDVVGACALQGMRRLHPALFAGAANGDGSDDTDAVPMTMQAAFSPGFGGVVCWPREALRVEGLAVGHVRPTRPNGFDEPSWDRWERDVRLFVLDSSPFPRLVNGGGCTNNSDGHAA